MCIIYIFIILLILMTNQDFKAIWNTLKCENAVLASALSKRVVIINKTKVLHAKDAQLCFNQKGAVSREREQTVSSVCTESKLVTTNKFHIVKATAKAQ